MLADTALVLGAYLLGSVPHLSLLAKLRSVELSGDFHQDLWNKGGNFLVLSVSLGNSPKVLCLFWLEKPWDLTLLL
jgi:hypothetical protein